MVFSAGLGTRLRPLTDRLPKALVPVDGVPMLERVAARMVAAGCRRLVVNVCPFADEVEAFVRERRGFGVETVVVREAPAPLETGGGLSHARESFRGDGPILLHNVDVLTDLDLGALVAAHRESAATATLAVQERRTARRLLFDDDGLFGRVDDGKGVCEPVASLSEEAEIWTQLRSGVVAGQVRYEHHPTEAGRIVPIVNVTALQP